MSIQLFLLKHCNLQSLSTIRQKGKLQEESRRKIYLPNWYSSYPQNYKHINLPLLFIYHFPANSLVAPLLTYKLQTSHNNFICSEERRGLKRQLFNINFLN